MAQVEGNYLICKTYRGGGRPPMCVRLMWHILLENACFFYKMFTRGLLPGPWVGAPLSVNMAQNAGKCIFLKLSRGGDMPIHPQAQRPFRYLRFVS